MRSPKHPFPVQTCFRQCFLVNFSIEPAVLAAALPTPLVPDTYGGRAWLSVVIARMERMRPVGVPGMLGITYNQVVYRAVVRCGDRRGVHFLRSDADSRIMAALGNAMSFFAFHHARIIFGDHAAGTVSVRSADGTADIEARFANPRPRLPSSSAFADLDEAKQWLVELFDAFHPRTPRLVDVVSIRRNDWRLTVVDDEIGRYAFMDGSGMFPRGTTAIDSIFAVKDLTYRWNRMTTLSM